MMLFDIGAHFGIFSLAALHYGGSEARAVAVDPSPFAVRMMQVQAQLNRVTDRLTITKAAVSDHGGHVPALDMGVIASGYVQVARMGDRRDLCSAPAVTLDDLFDLSGRAPTHVKIDVEGHESHVLRGGGRTLTEALPILFLELHNEMILNYGGDPHDTLSVLRELDYQTFSLDGSPIGEAAILRSPLIRIVASHPSSV
jgi:FkbM family methyltransferase